MLIMSACTVCCGLPVFLICWIAMAARCAACPVTVKEHDSHGTFLHVFPFDKTTCPLWFFIPTFFPFRFWHWHFLLSLAFVYMDELYEIETWSYFFLIFKTKIERLWIVWWNSVFVPKEIKQKVIGTVGNGQFIVTVFSLETFHCLIKEYFSVLTVSLSSYKRNGSLLYVHL